MKNSKGKMGTLTVDDQVLAALTEIAAKEGIGLDELAGQVLGDFVQQKEMPEEEKSRYAHGLDISVSQIMADYAYSDTVTFLNIILGYAHLLIEESAAITQEDIRSYSQSIL